MRADDSPELVVILRELAQLVLRCLIVDARSFHCPEIASLKIKRGDLGGDASASYRVLTH